MRWLVWIFLLVSMVGVLSGLVAKLTTRGFEASLEALVDGDVDGSVRVSCLEVIRDHGVASSTTSGDPGFAAMAAAAAVLLGDRVGFDRLVSARAAGAYLLGGEGVSASPVRRLALGEARVHQLFCGYLAENAGDLIAARQAYARSRAAAILTAGGDLCEILTAEALARLR